MKRFRQLIYLSASLLLLSGTLQAQLSEGGTPRSFQLALRSPVDANIMPAVDVQAYLAEDEIEEQEGLPFRFGAPHDVDYSLSGSGEWEELPDGSAIWRLRIVSQGAYSINLIYDDFYLPPGAQLFVYAEDHDMIIGAFTNRNNKRGGLFATAPVKGDDITVEYYEPVDVRGLGYFTITRIVHAYKDIFGFGSPDKDYGESGTCNVNINCPDGADWQIEKRSVAMVLLGDGTRSCSGSMVNNVREDETPYFLTANHCLNGEENWIIMFRYESPTCTDADGPTNHTVHGTTLRATNTYSDFALVELDEIPPESYDVYYAGWSNVDVAPSSAVGIHHPSGDIKKISFENDPLTSTDYLGSSGDSHWRVDDWDIGTTEGGSSGSALFDPDTRIVGQLHGGYAACGNNLADWYGKFSDSWDHGDNASERLRDWLDPDNSGATTLDGYDPYTDPVLDAVQRALAWLRARQTSGGYWNGPSGYSDRVAATSLALQTFLAAGYDPDDDTDVEEGIAYLLSQRQGNGGIYYSQYRSGYKCAMALTALKSAAKYNPANIAEINAAISAAEQYYVTYQSSYGGWRYRPHSYNDFDLSVSQWPILALKGVDNPGMWAAVRSMLHNRCRNNSTGGYGYRNASATGTMTCAGIWGEVIADGPQSHVDAAFAWLENSYGNTQNIVNAYDNAHRYYYLYSLAKACALANKTQLAGQDWYEVLSDKLISTQQTDHWTNTHTVWETDILSTVWALLSLQVGTVPPDSRIIIRLTGSSPIADKSGDNKALGVGEVEGLYLAVYDAEGNYAGPDENGVWITEIPGSNWNYTRVGQELEVDLTAAASFSIEIHNNQSAAADYLLEIEAYQGDNPDPVDEETYSGTVEGEQTIGTVASVNAIGGLSVYSSPPELFPQMQLTPTVVDFTPITNDAVYDFMFSVAEVGDSVALTNIDVFAGDMVDQFGNILPGSSFSFNPSHIDEIPAGGSVDVQGTLVVPDSTVLDLSEGGAFAGILTVESTRQSRSISLQGEARLMPVAFDIKPGSCPNPLNVKPYREDISVESEDNTIVLGKGEPDALDRKPNAVLPVAILGSDEYDVRDIDMSTVMLEGVTPLRSAFEDVGTPVAEDAGECECNDYGGDGLHDLSIKFSVGDVVEALGEVHDGDVVTLTITGELTDGTRFEGVDCVVILGNSGVLTDIGEAALLGNHPNPFNPTTDIRFYLPEARNVTLTVYNIIGQRVTTLVDGRLEAGNHCIAWDGSRAASGIYVYHIEAGDFSDSRKMVLMK